MIDLKRLMFDMSLSQRDIAQIIGTAQSEVSHFANGRRDLKGQYLQSLIAHFGEEVIHKYTLPDNAFTPKTSDAKVTILTPETVEEIKQLGREEAQQGSDVVRVPFINRKTATAPDLDVRELVQQRSPQLEIFPFRKMFEGVDYIQTVITMAMAPRYMPGDYLFISFREGKVMSGKIYLVDTRPYGTMLRFVYHEDNGYTLKACNPKFKDVFVKEEDVYSISSVVLSVNTNTSLTPELNLVEEVKIRGKQIQELTDTQNKAMEGQRELIAEIRKQNERMERMQLRNDEMVDRLLKME